MVCYCFVLAEGVAGGSNLQNMTITSASNLHKRTITWGLSLLRSFVLCKNPFIFLFEWGNPFRCSFLDLKVDLRYTTICCVHDFV